MTNFSLPDDFATEETVIFLGSGFSREATAINRKPMPMGGQLDDRLADALHLPQGRYQGKTLAQVASKKGGAFLQEFLYNNLSTETYETFHSDIIGRKWFRLYTTNFDDLVERIRRDSHSPVEPYTFRDKIPNKIDINSVVHLHGYIGSVTEANASTELVYALNSYAALHSERPEWLTEFNRSVRFARHVVFVGYSTEYDEHIRDILALVPGLKEKTFFILGGNPDPVHETILEDYGQVYWCGADGFSKSLTSIKNTPPPAIDINRLRSFDYFNPSKDKKSYASVTFTEIANLLAFGSYHRSRFYRDLADGKYLIYRDKSIEQAVQVIEQGRSVLLHSHLGNGKTLFIETLGARLTEDGYACFLFKGETSSLLAENQFIGNLKKAVILIDDYTVAREIIPAIAKVSDSIKFVVTIRTGTYDYRSAEVARVLGSEIGVIDLNWLDKNEFKKFDIWASKAGIITNRHREGYGRLRHVREFILDKFENSKLIHEKVEKLTASLTSERRAFRAFVVLMTFRHIGEEAQADVMTYQILGYDPRLVLKPFADLWGEVSGSDGAVESSIFSEFVISKFVDPDDLLRIVEEIVTAMAPIRLENKRYDAIFAKCLNFGTLFRLCGGNDRAVAAVVSSYNRLRHNVAVESQPLFWLQVAIAMNAKGDLRAAWTYLKVAYSKVLKDFEPYHIDTKALEVLFRLGALPDEQFGDDEFRGLDEALAGCVAMISNDRNRTDVLRALSYSLAFFEIRGGAFDKGEKVRLAFHISVASRQLGLLPADIRMQQDIGPLKRKLDQSLELLK